MKVILLCDVKGKGKKGDVLDVSSGYARNYLLPKKLAEIATEESLLKLEKYKQEVQKKYNEEKQKALELAKKLESLTLDIYTKVGKDGKIYGSITSKNISELLLQKFQIHIDRKQIRLLNPLKALGKVKVPIKLHKEVLANLMVSVKSDDRE